MIGLYVINEINREITVSEMEEEPEYLKNLLEYEGMEEPEYIKSLREYYNQNLQQYGAKTYFVDLTNDGQDEMVVSYRCRDEDAYISESNLSIYAVKEGKVIEVFFDTGENMCWLLEDGKEYLLTSENEQFFLWRRSYIQSDNRYEYHKIVIADTNSLSVCETAVDFATFNEKMNPGIVIMTTGFYDNFLGISLLRELKYESVLEEKETLVSVLNGNFGTDNVVAGYSLTQSVEKAVVFAVTCNLEESTGQKGQNLNIWCKDTDNFDKIDEFLGEEIGYQYNDSYLLQFGKEQHFTIEAIVFASGSPAAQYKYCFEDNKAKKIDYAPYLFLNDAGEVYATFDVCDEEADFWMDGYRPDYVGIIYKDSQYMQYGMTESSFEQIESYSNWREISLEIDQAIRELGFPISQIDRIEQAEVIYSADGYYFINYKIEGNTYVEGLPYVWNYAKVKENGDKLTFVEIGRGKRYIHTGLSLPIYYGEGEPLAIP